LQGILHDSKGEQQKLEALQQREAGGETVPQEERDAVAKELARLREQLDAERKRHAELVQQAQSLGIARSLGAALRGRCSSRMRLQIAELPNGINARNAACTMRAISAALEISSRLRG
jgi:hypothetical protein